jgi:hypothetical protein
VVWTPHVKEGVLSVLCSVDPDGDGPLSFADQPTMIGSTRITFLEPVNPEAGYFDQQASS